MPKLMDFTGTILKNLISKPVTTNYPFEPKEYPERTRGHVEINIEECIMCGMCQRNCPPGAILVDRATGVWKIQRFDCVQCGYCVECCPKKCLSIVPGYPEPGEEKREEAVTKPVQAAAKEDSKAAAADIPADGIPQVDSEKCVYCTLCAKKCPSGAIEVDRAEKTWKLDEEKCVHCGLCASSCPKKCITMVVKQ